MLATLPLPPSTNRYWRAFRGRVVLSKEAREYKRNAAFRALCQGMRPLSGPVWLFLRVFQSRGDLSNRIKVLEDALQGVAYENDSQVTHLEAKLCPKKDGEARVEVEVVPALHSRTED